VAKAMSEAVMATDTHGGPTQSAAAQLGQKREPWEWVVVEVPEYVPDSQLRGLPEIGRDLIGRAL
jgi:hypothetical protein